MDGADDEFLARAVLAGDQDRGIADGDLRDELAHGVHRAAVADDDATTAGLRLQHAAVGDGFLVRQAVGDRDQQPVAVDRLLHEVVGALPHRRDRGLDVAMARDHDDRHADVRGAEPLQHLEPVETRHLDVQQHDVGSMPLGLSQAVGAVCGLEDLVAVILQVQADGVTDGRIVVDDEDGLHGVSLRARRRIRLRPGRRRRRLSGGRAAVRTPCAADRTAVKARADAARRPDGCCPWPNPSCVRWFRPGCRRWSPNSAASRSAPGSWRTGSTHTARWSGTNCATSPATCARPSPSDSTCGR